jgi:Na+-translocating ferredoxin:NAD+ oxidoreductase RnfG subunit
LESAGTWAINAADKVMDADNNAYRRLRKDGVQPETVTGAAKLEATLK